MPNYAMNNMDKYAVIDEAMKSLTDRIRQPQTNNMQTEVWKRLQAGEAPQGILAELMPMFKGREQDLLKAVATGIMFKEKMSGIDLEGLQGKEIQQKLDAKPTNPFLDSYHKQSGENQANIDFPVPGEIKPPQTRTIKMGDKEITQEWNGKSWVKIADAPRYKHEVNVTNEINTAADPTKATKNKLQGEIVDLTGNLDTLRRIKDTTQDEYLTTMGNWKYKGKKALARLTGDKGDEFAKSYSAWETDVKQFMLAWRKLITGVAGGEKEMQAIERATINTDHESIDTFWSKLSKIERITEAAIRRKQEFLSEGFKLDKMAPIDRAKILKNAPLSKYMKKREAETQKIIARGIEQETGRKIVKYEDGTIEYAE